MCNINLLDEVSKSIDKIQLYSNIDKSTLINELLIRGINSYNIKMSGGVNLSLPNPDFFTTNKAELKEFLNCVIICQRNNKSGYNVPLYAIANYIEQRVFFDDNATLEEFKKYFYSVQCDESQSDK